MADLERGIARTSSADGAWEFLKVWAEKNPQPAALIFGAIACCAAAAVIVSFGIQLNQSAPLVLYILGIGIALAVATAIVNNTLMMAGLSWFALGLGAAWVATFIVYKSTPLGTTRSQQLSCVVFFWNDCANNADKGALAAHEASVTPLVVTIAPPPPAITTSKYEVVVQFAGTLTRDSVRGMMMRLKQQGWNVQGVDGGGERTSAADGTSEIRAGEGDKAAAQALAATVQSLGLTGRALPVKINNSFPSGHLEVWISR